VIISRKGRYLNNTKDEHPCPQQDFFFFNWTVFTFAPVDLFNCRLCRVVLRAVDCSREKSDGFGRERTRDLGIRTWEPNNCAITGLDHTAAGPHQIYTIWFVSPNVVRVGEHACVSSGWGTTWYETATGTQCLIHVHRTLPRFFSVPSCFPNNP
jgi:hypothetical protein